MKQAIYFYNIPLLARALLSLILFLKGEQNNSPYYGFQIILYKIGLFIAIIVGFKMKSIYIQLNADRYSQDVYSWKLKKFIIRSRIYLALFILDILMSVILTIWLLCQNEIHESNQVSEYPSVMFLLITYAVIWIVQFVYMIYVSIMFVKMAEKYLTYLLELQGFNLWAKRVLSGVVIVLFNMAQTHFFLLNAICLIGNCIGIEQLSGSFRTTIEVFEWCELFLPLILGYYMVFLIMELGFIEEDDEEDDEQEETEE